MFVQLILSIWAGFTIVSSIILPLIPLNLIILCINLNCCFPCCGANILTSYVTGVVETLTLSNDGAPYPLSSMICGAQVGRRLCFYFCFAIPVLPIVVFGIFPWFPLIFVPIAGVLFVIPLIFCGLCVMPNLVRCCCISWVPGLIILCTLEPDMSYPACVSLSIKTVFKNLGDHVILHIHDMLIFYPWLVVTVVLFIMPLPVISDLLNLVLQLLMILFVVYHLIYRIVYFSKSMNYGRMIGVSAPMAPQQFSAPMQQPMQAFAPPMQVQQPMQMQMQMGMAPPGQ